MLALAAALLMSAQPSNAWLDEARALIAKLEFGQAIERLEVARTVPGNDASTSKAILEWLAYCQVAEGRREDAERTFITLFEVDPGAAISADVSSPKVVEAFDAARRRHFPPDYVKLTESPSPAGRAQLTLVDPWSKVARVVLHQRNDDAPWTAAPLEGQSGRYTFPLVLIEGGRLEWFVEALAADDTVLATVGTSASPRQLRVPRVTQEANVRPAPSNTKVVLGVVSLGVGIALSAIATGLQVGAWNQRLEARDRTQAPGDFAATALAAERNALTQQNWAIGLFVAGGVTLGTGLVLVW